MKLCNHCEMFEFSKKESLELKLEAQQNRIES